MGACTEWLEVNNFTMRMVATVGSIVCVSLLNVLLNQFFFQLDAWTKHRTLTGLCMSSMNKLFMALYVNTGIMYLLVSADFHGFINAYGPLYKLGKGPNSDLYQQWFVTSGQDFFMTTLTNTFVFGSSPLITAFFVTPVLIRVLRRGLVTVESLQEVYMLPEWPLSLRLAQTVCTFFCVAMYSGGMPLLYLVGALYCLISYWADKVCLLRGARQPPTYNEDLVEQAVNWIFLAGFVHVCITSWMFGNQELFPSPWSMARGAFENIFNMPMEDYTRIQADWQKNYVPLKYPRFPEYIHSRMLDMSRQGAIPGALLLIFFVGYFFFYLFLWNTILSPIPYFADKMRAAQEKLHMPDAGGHGDVQIETAIELHGASRLLSYKMEANPKYSGAYQAMKFCESNDLTTEI